MSVEQPESEFENWARQCELGNLNSPTTRQLHTNRHLTVQQYISQFRKGSLNSILPEEAKLLTVEESLKLGRVGSVNIRKLLTDNREKFTR